MMAMVSLHPSSLLAIIVAILFSIAVVTAQITPPIYNICSGSGPTVVTVNENSAPFIIRSPNYGNGYYGNNVDCSFIIRSQQGPLVLSFEYRVFDLQGSQDCISDSLCVVGVKFCGKWAQGRMFQQFLPGNSNSTVHFLTDSSVTRSGFHIIVTSQPTGGQTLHQVEGSGWDQNAITYVPARYYPGMPYRDGCGYTPTHTRIYNICDGYRYNFVRVNPSSGPLIIQSPNFSSNYSNNLACTLVLKSGREPLILSFDYRYFNLEDHLSCNYDSLCVNGVKFCGSWLGGRLFQHILPENSASTVHFRTDNSVTRPGFNIIVTPQLAGHQTVNQVVGTGSSPSSNSFVAKTYYPGMSYSDVCTQPPPVGITDVYYQDVVTTPREETPTPREDTPTPREDTPTPREDTPTAEPEDTTTPTTVNDVYYFCNNGQSNIIDIRANNFPLIRSPRYPLAPYYDNQLCSVVLRSGAYPLVVNLHFRDFQVELHGQCSYDSLCVHGVPFCGEWLTGYNFQYILPGNSNFTLIFKTDSSVVQRGFEIAVNHWSAISQVINQPALDVGSSNASLSYTIDRYQPGYHYTDRCVTLNPYTPEYPMYANDTVTDDPYPATNTTTTDGPHAGGQLCYSAAYVREVTAAIDRAIDDLNRAKELLRQNN